MYKILTSILSATSDSHLVNYNLLPSEQKGCRKGSYGCKDQLLINKAILEDTKTRKKNLSTAWVDYKKAFDSVPHNWVLKCLETYKISLDMKDFIKASMTKWKTTLTLTHDKGTISPREIKINSGIFQGDSLTPLLFCIALAPLSSLLNESNYGYMDDLKTYAMSDEDQKGLPKIVKVFNDDIRMEFGLDKCAKAAFKRGKLAYIENMELDVGTTLQDLEQESTYKYLGVNEGDGIQHAKMKEKIWKEYYRRIRLVLKSELNAANRIDAINTLAVPVVAYSFIIINWKMEELMRLDRKTRKFLRWQKCTTQKLTWTGFRGLVQLEITYKTTTIGLNTYLSNKDDSLLKIAKDHDRGKKTMSIHHQAAKYWQDLSLPEAQVRVKLKAKHQALEQLKSKWEEKHLHGQYPK